MLEIQNHLMMLSVGVDRVGHMSCTDSMREKQMLVATVTHTFTEVKQRETPC